MGAPGFSVGDYEAKVNEARQLMAKAKVKASKEFEHFVQGGRDLLGDRPKLQQAISGWTRAATTVNQVEGLLTKVENPVLYYWEGGSATAFSGWVNRVKTQNITPWKTTATTAIVTALNDATKAVGDFLNGLYKALVNLITGLADAASGLFGMLKKALDPGEIADIVVKALTAFATTCQQLFETMINAMASFDTAGNNIRLAGAALAGIEDPGSGLTDMPLQPKMRS